VGTEQLGMANGIIQALTIIAILFSSFAFSFFFESHYIASNDPNVVLQSVWGIGIALIAFSALEAYFAFKIPFFPQTAELSEEKFSAKQYVSLHYLKENIRTLRQNKNIWLSVIGLSLFWGVSQVIVAAFPAHYKAIFHADNAIVIQAILAVSGLGLILGSYVAGKMSHLHIELGIVPVGAVGIFISLFCLTLTDSNLFLTICSFAFGFFGGVFFVPFLYGSNAGLGMQAGFYGLQSLHTRDHLLQAVYEGVIFSLMQHLEQMLKRFPNPTALRVTGGPAKSAVWLQMLADLSGLTVEVPQVEETGCLGAALMAMVGDGIFKDARTAQQQISMNIISIQPDLSAHDKYRRKYRRYQALVNHLATFNTELQQNIL